MCSGAAFCVWILSPCRYCFGTNFSKPIEKMSLSNYFRERATVAQIYWFWIFGVSILSGLIQSSISFFYLRVSDPHTILWLDRSQIAFLGAFALYLLVMLRNLWRACHRARRPGFWGWVAMALVVVAIVRTGYSTLTLVFPHLPVPLIMVELELRDLNKQLPQEIEEGLVLRRTHLRDKAMVYVFYVDEELPEDMKPYLEESLTLDDPENMETCRMMQGYFRGGVVALEHQYSYQMGSVTARMSGADCLERLSQER